MMLKMTTIIFRSRCHWVVRDGVFVVAKPEVVDNQSAHLWLVIIMLLVMMMEMVMKAMIPMKLMMMPKNEVILLARNDVNGQYDNHQQIDLHNCQNWRSLELDHPLGTYTQMCQLFSCLYQTHFGRFSLVQLSRQWLNAWKWLRKSTYSTSWLWKALLNLS